MRTRLWCVVAACVSIAAPAAAQTVLTEADALARLSADSPRVRAIRAGVELARADVLAATRWPNPRMTFNRESVAGGTENIVTVTQSLPITGRRQLEGDAASALVEAYSRRADEDIRRARAELRQAYAALVSAQLREGEIAHVLDRVSGLSERLSRREAAGDAAGYDVLRAQREVLDLEAALSDARADRARAQTDLGSFFVTPDVTAIVATPPTTASRAQIPDLTALTARAEATRGELAALQQEIESARFADRAASRRLVPEPELVAGTKSSNVGSGDIGGVISVHVSIPLFDRAQPERALAQARLAQAEARVESFRVSLTAQVSGLRALVVQRREAADRHRTAATKTAAALERIAQVSYDAGERGILELLDSYRSSASAATRQIELDALVRAAEIELEFMTGWEMQ
jgi:outer membrane protein, heavy metal efflux system